MAARVVKIWRRLSASAGVRSVTPATLAISMSCAGPGAGRSAVMRRGLPWSSKSGS
jgi:hypothetical protein